MSREPCVMGIDIGTGSAKGVITDVSGRILATAVRQHSVSNPRPGWYEQDADEIWWEDVTSLSKELIRGLDPSYEIVSFACSAIAPCVLPIDERGRALRPGILYGIDTRAEKQIHALEAAIGEDTVYEKTGAPLSSQSCCPKILWIREHEPEVYEKTWKFLTASGYIGYKLTGRCILDIYDGIGYGPLFDLHSASWDAEYESQICPLSMMPELLWTNEICGFISSAASIQTGLPAGIPVTAGTADAAAEALAAGVSSVGDMMMMYGSSNFFIMRTNHLRKTRSFWPSNFVCRDQSVLTGGMATVGSMFDWFTKTFPGRSLEQWEQLAAASPPGANGVRVLPYFAGERTPLFDAQAKAVFFGLSLHTSPGDIFRALLEAVGFGIMHNIEVMREQGEEARNIIAIGGGIQSSNMMQAVCDITGYEQTVPSCTLGACYGDAMLAAAAADLSDLEDAVSSWVRPQRVFTPDPGRRAVYAEAYGTYRELYESTKHLL